MQNIEVEIQKKIWFSLVGRHLTFLDFTYQLFYLEHPEILGKI